MLVDGYAHLGDGRKGLGAYLYDALDWKIAVGGVAKTYFKGAEDFALSLLRGMSKVPLWITAVGTDAAAVRDGVARMAGDYRLPALLKLLDETSRAR